ncbi:SVEP1 protein, partial [Polypterus senegalus]|nr:SVEP1 protein [Polypterus senegalus]
MKTALCLFGTLVELVVLLGLLGLVTRDCGNPPSVANAAPRSEFLVETVFTDGSKPLFYECIPGYIKEKGNYGITCTGSSWSVPRLVCKTVECHIPPEIENGSHFSMGRVQYRSVVIYTCNPGFDMIGNYQITCESNGEYSSPPPKCSSVKCPDPPVIENGSHDPVSSIRSGLVVTYNCNPGFDMIGNHQITCKSNGKYSSRPPKCISGKKKSIKDQIKVSLKTGGIHPDEMEVTAADRSTWQQLALVGTDTPQDNRTAKRRKQTHEEHSHGGCLQHYNPYMPHL